MNSDEAGRCLDIARDAIAAGDFSKALRFIEKSKRMHPSERVRGKLHQQQCSSESRNVF